MAHLVSFQVTLTLKNRIWLDHLFSPPLIGIVGEEKPQCFHADVVNSMTGLLEVAGDSCVMSAGVFLETGVKGASTSADVDFGVFGAIGEVHDGSWIVW